MGGRFYNLPLFFYFGGAVYDYTYCDLIQIRYSMCANDWVLEPDDNDGMRE